MNSYILIDIIINTILSKIYLGVVFIRIIIYEEISDKLFGEIHREEILRGIFAPGPIFP